MLKTAFRFGIAASLCCVISLSSGCFGSFALTQKFHEFNEGVSENKWIREVVFFFDSPIYGITSMADAIVFNSL